MKKSNTPRESVSVEEIIAELKKRAVKKIAKGWHVLESMLIKHLE